MTKKLIIIGASAFAEIAYEYFTHDSEFEVIGFSIDDEFVVSSMKYGLPIVPYSEITERYDPKDHWFFVAIPYREMNQVRKRFYAEMKSKGFKPASYISSQAFVWRNCNVGDHVFIFENNTIQPFVEIGENTIIWSGNHVGHHSVIGANCFISSHVVISGYCKIGDNSFLGVNTTISDNVSLGNMTFCGAGTVIQKDSEQNSVYQIKSTEKSRVTAERLFRVKQK